MKFWAVRRRGGPHGGAPKAGVQKPGVQKGVAPDCWAPKGGGSKGAGPNLEKSGAPKGGGPKMSLFFPLPPPFSLFLFSLGGSSRVGLSHDSPRGPKRAHLRVPAFNHTKRGRKNEIVAGDGKQERNFRWSGGGGSQGERPWTHPRKF